MMPEDKQEIQSSRHQRSRLEYSHMKNVTYGNCTGHFQELQAVQVVQEDLQVHRNQSLVVLVVPEVQEGQLLSHLLGPKMRNKIIKRKKND